MSNIPDRIPPRVSVNKEDQAGPPPAKEEDRISRLAHKVMETLSAIKQQVTPKRSERSGSDDQSKIASHLSERLSDVSKISNPDAQKAEAEQIDKEIKNLPEGFDKVIKQLEPEIQKMKGQAEETITPQKPPLPRKPDKPLPPPKPTLSPEQQQRIKQFTQADKKSSIPKEFTKLIAEHEKAMVRDQEEEMGPSSEGAQTVSEDPKAVNKESAHTEETGSSSTSEPAVREGVRAGGEESVPAAEGRSSLLGRVTKGLLGHLKALGGKIQSVATKVWDTVMSNFSPKEFNGSKNIIKRELNNPEAIKDPKKMKEAFEFVDKMKKDIYSYLKSKQKKELNQLIPELKSNAKDAVLQDLNQKLTDAADDGDALFNLLDKIDNLNSQEWFQSENAEDDILSDVKKTAQDKTLAYFEKSIENLNNDDINAKSDLVKKQKALLNLPWFEPKDKNSELKDRYTQVKVDLGKIGDELQEHELLTFDQVAKNPEMAFVIPFVASKLNKNLEAQEEVEMPDFLEKVKLYPSEGKTFDALADDILKANKKQLKELSIKLADTLYAQDLKIYQQITVDEFAAKRDSGNRPNFDLLEERFSALSTKTIPDDLDDKEKAKLISFYLRVADNLMEKGDHETPMSLSFAILGKMNDSIKKHLDKTSKGTLEKHSKLIQDDMSNYLPYRNKMASKSQDKFIIPNSIILAKDSINIGDQLIKKTQKSEKKISPEFLNNLKTAFKSIQNIKENIEDLDPKLDSPLYIKMKKEPPKRDKGKEKI